MTAPRADLDELGRLLAEATPGPWEVGDYWHIQGARHCRCDAGPLAWEGVRNINGTRMQTHIHRRLRPIGSDIMQADASDGYPATVSHGSDFGPGVEAADAALIAALVNAAPALLAEVADLREKADALPQPSERPWCRACGPGYRLGDEGCRHDDHKAIEGETGICRTCALPIWWEKGTIGHREVVGWSDRIERGGDSVVCFKAVGYRHVPMGAREEAIYRAGFRAALDGAR